MTSRLAFALCLAMLIASNKPSRQIGPLTPDGKISGIFFAEV